MGEVRVFHRNTFLCRAVSADHAGDSITLKDIQAARVAHRRRLRSEIGERKARVADFFPALHELLPWKWRAAEDQREAA